MQPRGCWLENNKCCYWWLGPKQDIANACPSLSNYCSLWAPDSDKPIATPSIHWSIYPAILFALLLNWEKKKTRRKYKIICCNDDRHSACLLWVSSSGSRNRTLWLDTALMQLCILPTHPTTPGHCTAMPWVKCADSCMLMLEPNLLYFISYIGRTEAQARSISSISLVLGNREVSVCPLSEYLSPPERNKFPSPNSLKVAKFVTHAQSTCHYLGGCCGSDSVWQRVRVQ